MSTEALVQALIIVNVLTVVVGLGVYVWYGFALSRLFPKLGAEAWKGWVPILNEAEILARGGLPAWNVVFYFIPVVQLYGIYLKAIAVHRIGESFGRGSGFAVLGVFLPPLWATLLAAQGMPAAGAYDRRVEGLVAQPADPAAPTGPVLAPPVYASAPPPPPAAPVPVAFPSLAAAGEPPFPPLPEQPPAPAASQAPPAPPAAPAPTAAPAPAPEPEGSVYHPWSRAPVAAPVPLPSVADTVIHPVPVEDDDELDRTVAIDRRPVVPWRIVTDEGHVIPLRRRTVILGRKPTTTTADVDVIAVPDTTKTLSKNHARLELSDEGTWTVHDLASTNGVIIIEPDGTETLLPEGGSAPIPGRFMLGKVALRVAFDDTESTR